ncbi:MAG: Crp/Fnr family transcriptional regulator [Microscillaceae bacterium]|nr:Crp/Fnr family transcriptional regulator [Microscillaceae bacterium]
MEQDNLFQFFSSEFPFNKDGLELFIQSFECKKFEKNTVLLKSEGSEKALRFLDEGIIREFYAHEGKEKNIGFYLEPGFITDFYSFLSNKPTKKNQACITDVKIRVLSKQKFLDFSSEYPCGKLFIDEIFRRIIEKKEKEEFKQFVNTAEDDYLELLHEKPLWLQNIPQYHIASYLGISPETLSRIRKRIQD